MNRVLAIISLSLVGLVVFVGAGVGAGAVWWNLAGGQASASFDDDQPPGAPAIPGVEPEEEQEEQFDYPLIGFGSVDDIEITETAKQAIDALGTDFPNDIYDEQCGSYLLAVLKDDIVLLGLAESNGAYGALDTLTVANGFGTNQPSDVEWKSLPRTAEGIGLGSTRAEAEAAYPGQLTARPHLYVENGYYLDLAGPGDLGMMFSTDANGVIDAISTGRSPQIFFPEGCA